VAGGSHSKAPRVLIPFAFGNMKRKEESLAAQLGWSLNSLYQKSCIWTNTEGSKMV
jgi:hypothetical protein